MRNLGVFESRNGDDFKRSDAVIVRTDRGLETGQILCQAAEDPVPELDGISGTIVRAMAAEDFATSEQQKNSRPKQIDVCQRYIRASGLQMKLIDIEELFGGERIVVYYLADERVDFRELVKALAGEFKTRIEMRQIGVRDEAKMLADYGDCGKPVCCNTHLSSMPPVSMKMAKLQKATLDPTKISGRCGRLKCCLRYEFEMYEELQREMPKIGSRIVTSDGHATVLAHELLAGQLLIETEDNRKITIAKDDVLAVVQKSHSTNS